MRTADSLNIGFSTPVDGAPLCFCCGVTEGLLEAWTSETDDLDAIHLCMACAFDMYKWPSEATH